MMDQFLLIFVAFATLKFGFILSTNRLNKVLGFDYMKFVFFCLLLCSVTYSALSQQGIVVVSGNANQTFFTDDKKNLSWDFDSKQLSVNGTIAVSTVNVSTGMITGVYPTISTKTTHYTLLDSDNGTIIECNSAGSVTITLPNGLLKGFQCIIVNRGTGTVTLSASTTLESKGTNLVDQYTAASLYHRGSNVWVAFGALE